MGGTPLLALSVAAFPEELPTEVVARGLRRRRRAGARRRRDPRRRPHDPRRRAEVRARRRRHRPSRRHLASRAARGPATRSSSRSRSAPGSCSRSKGDARRGRALDDDAQRPRRPRCCGRSRRTRSPTSPASACSATRTRRPSGAACAIVLEAAALPALDGALEAARAASAPAAIRATATSPGRTSTATACPEELLALAYDAQTAGGLLVTLPAEKALSLEAEFGRAGLFLARVGSVEEGAGVVLSYLGNRSTLVPCTRSPPRRRCRRLARRSRRSRFRRVARVAVGVLVLIVATGATVRLTGSGLGCPQWPRPAAAEGATERAATTRTSSSQPRRLGVSPCSRRSRSPSAAWRTRGSRAGARSCSPRGRLRRDARAGAARRDHRLLRPQPVPRHLASAARRSSCSALGVLVLLEAARLVRGAAPRAARARARRRRGAARWRSSSSS